MVDFYIKIRKLFRYIFKTIYFFNINNSATREDAFNDYCYNKLRKKYNKFIVNWENKRKKKIRNNVVYFCWLQGIDNAPSIVRACYKSLKRNIVNGKILLIDANNFQEYVDLPKYIIDKWSKGIISNAHFTDLLRNQLLIEHGGIWIDSTCYLTDKFDVDIYNKDLFVFKQVKLNGDKNQSIVSSNWFIGSVSSNDILCLVQDLLFDYWKKNNFACNYFIYHLFFSISVKKYSACWDNIPTFNNINPHILQFELLNRFNENRWNEVKKNSFIHKLNWRINSKNCNYLTFYDMIIEREDVQ